MSGFPDMADAFSGWDEQMTFKRIERAIVDHKAVERTVDEGPFNGVLQPIQQRKLMAKPEGERAWQWWTLWTTQPLTFGTTIVGPGGRRYRVVTAADYGTHTEYEITDEVNK